MSSRRLERALLASRDRPSADRIPYDAHVTNEIVHLATGEYLQVLRLSGVSFESSDDASLNGWHNRLNVLWRNIASPQVAIWTHLIRRLERAYPAGECPEGFAARLVLGTGFQEECPGVRDRSAALQGNGERNPVRRRLASLRSFPSDPCNPHTPDTARAW